MYIIFKHFMYLNLRIHIYHTHLIIHLQVWSTMGDYTLKAISEKKLHTLFLYFIFLLKLTLLKPFHLYTGFPQQHLYI